MPALQTIYNEYPPVAYEGSRANLEQWNSISRTVETVAGIGFGKVVVQGAGDHGIDVPATSATLATAASAVKASGANTGNGTFVLDGSTPILANADAGVYQLRAITAGTNTATFRLYDTRGRTLKDYTFNGSGATVTTDDQIKGVITDGSTDFVVGDGFDITVTLAAASKFVGISVRDQAVDAYNPGASPSYLPNTYLQYDSAGVMTQGAIWIVVTANVNVGDAAYFVPTTGAITNVSSGNIAVPRSRFDTTASSSTLAILRIS